MNLNRTEKALLTLLRAGLWNKEPDGKGLFPLSEQEWQEVYRLAKEQTVAGPILQGICLLEDEQMPPLELTQIWLAHVDQIEHANRQMNERIKELLVWMRGNNLHPIVMKGQGVARYYEEPLQRTCGDIDLYFALPEDFEKAVGLARQKGLATCKEADGAYSYQWKGVEVELHQRLIDIYNPRCQKSILRLIEQEGMDGSYPTPLLTILLLNAHLLKHIMGHGVGLRQFADMARACYVLHGQFSTAAYEKVCQTWGIQAWTQELNSILNDIMGLPQAYLPSSHLRNKQTEYILQKVLKGGNFGKHGQSRGNEEGSTWGKKWHTAQSFLKDWKQNRQLAPAETFWITASLALGQFKID